MCVGERGAYIGPRDAKIEDCKEAYHPLKSPFSSLPGTIALFQRKQKGPGLSPAGFGGRDDREGCVIYPRVMWSSHCCVLTV